LSYSCLPQRQNGNIILLFKIIDSNSQHVFHQSVIYWQEIAAFYDYLFWGSLSINVCRFLQFLMQKILPLDPAQNVTNRAPSQIVAALAVLPTLLAFPTNISSTLESRDTYSGLPSTLTITTYGDEGCGKAHMIWPNVAYRANKSAQILGTRLVAHLSRASSLI